MKNVAYWWVFFWAQVVGVAAAYYYGFLNMMWDADVSKVSIAIAGILLLGTLDVGRRTHKALRGDQTQPLFSWYLADTATAFGLIGTLIGFIVMFGGAIGTLNGIVNEAALKVMLISLASGIGTAVWTTLAGLVASLSIKFQLNNLEILQDTMNSKSEETTAVQLLNE